MPFLNKIRKNGETFDLQDGRIPDTTASENTFLHINNIGSIEWATPQLSELVDDDNHRTVTDDEKSIWNKKQDALNDLVDIREGATLGKTSVQSVAVKMNGEIKGEITGSGTIDLGTVITSLSEYYTSEQTDIAIANAIGNAIGGGY